MYYSQTSCQITKKNKKWQVKREVILGKEQVVINYISIIYRFYRKYLANFRDEPPAIFDQSSGL